MDAEYFLMVMMKEMTIVGGAYYADIGALAYRQVLGVNSFTKLGMVTLLAIFTLLHLVGRSLGTIP